MKYDEQIDLTDFVAYETYENEINQPLQYTLQAVSVHDGTIQGGHYVAFVKKEDGNWYKTNDERVGKVSREEALN